MDRVIEFIKASKNDATQVFKSWGYNPSNFRYLSAPPQTNVADAQTYLDRIMENPSDPVFHIVTDTTVGLIKAKLDGHRALVGYVVNEPFWGQGIATAALRQMVFLLQENPKIQRIWATCATDNPGSSAVLEKCGFIREGTLRNWIVYPAQGAKLQDNFSYYLPSNI